MLLQKSERKNETRWYHDVDGMAQSFVNSQFHGGIFSNDDVANELSVRPRIVQHVRCK